MRNVWTKEEESYLLANYETKTNNYISKKLGRSRRAVATKGFNLGLKKNNEARINSGCYKKGHKPFNKGKKWDKIMSKEAQANSRKTCFKKGHVPHNIKPEGHECWRSDGYLYVKYKGKNRQKHRVLWEQHHGTIPKGYHVVFKDGNRANITIDNLELLSQEESMRRNTYHNYPPELAQLIQLKGALNRQIRKHGGNKKNAGGRTRRNER